MYTDTSVGGTLPVESLRFTHDTISPVFHAGNHCGSPLVGLVSDLCTDLAGVIQVLPPLQVVWHMGRVAVVVEQAAVVPESLHAWGFGRCRTWLRGTTYSRRRPTTFAEKRT